MNCDESGNYQRFVELWTDYLEGDLDESGIAELRRLLAADEQLVMIAADLYQTHRLLGLAADKRGTRRDDFVRQTLARLPAKDDRFVDGVMRRLGRRTNGTAASGLLSKRFWARRAGWVVAAAAIAALLFVWPRSNEQVARDTQDSPRDVAPLSNVRFASLAYAKFFGELSPPVRSSLVPRRDYILTSGMAEVSFPSGAVAIIEGPAVFRAMSDTTLGLDLGRCSVHAPDGAEGFRVETPFTRVVDRGTRFAVCVDETSETKVQVVEGIADVYGRPPQFNAITQAVMPERTDPADGSSFEIRLTQREARRFPNGGLDAIKPAIFTSSVYRRGLPDRVVSYEAKTAGGGAESLTSVTVQRGGRTMRYPVDHLVPATLSWFKSEASDDPNGYLVGDASLPEPRSALLSDRVLNSGVINPGGSIVPLSSDPVMNWPEKPDQSNTPGMAVQFREPVVNGPGPDVVFFELQTVSNPPNGDAFHVSPLRFTNDRHAHTIDHYDLTMTSSEALILARFHLYSFEGPVGSPAELETVECGGAPLGLSFRAVVAGIDLSDLGFAAGESADGLFFQDAEDNEHRVDPTYIAGLPEIQDRHAEKP